MDEITPPKRLGRFEILRPLGEGGMGQVYLAKDPTIGREVAIKVINTELVKGGRGRERFIHEAKAAGSLSHPNLITIHEFGEDEGVLFLVMEYLPGQDLSVFLRNHSISQEEALEVCAQICDGLASAHERGIFHRDVKPSNVRVRRESGRLLVKLMDFGVARMPGSKLTATGDVVGTYAYMAPEYLRGGEAGVQSDLYPVGMMLCEALTGELPQMGPTLPHGAAGRKRQAAKPQPTAVSPVIWNLLDKALSPDPTHRFASALEFSRALRAAIPLVGAAPAPEARPADAPPPAAAAAPKPLTIVRTAEPEPAKVWPWLVGAVVVVGGLTVWQLREKQAPPTQGPAAQPPSQAQSPAQNQPRQVVPAAAPPQMQAPIQGQNQAPNPGQSGAPRPQDPPPNAPPPKPEPADSLNRGPSSQDLAFVHAQAEAFAAAYNRERWSDMGGVLDELAVRRIDGGTFGQESAVREVMQSNRASRRIPRDLMDRIRTYLPPPPGGEQSGPPQQQGPR